jgi:UDP-N-acetylmuramoyl-L-alanyl-D-glutamate--2,6-diaminopimelate ligase
MNQGHDTVPAEQLVQALPHVTLHYWRPVRVRGIAMDSRKVRPGDLFVAIPGGTVDGHRFVSAALQAGAVACCVERDLAELEGVPTAIVPNAREALAYLHAAWQGYPGRQLRVIGVTGTDGKTTTVRLIAEILRTAGHAVGRIDTVSASVANEELDTGFHTTTPDAPELQAYLARMVKAGMEYAVLETTSHGLAQHRVTGSEYDVAVVTNITHEHLDYHGSYEAYREAKAMLFRSLNTAYHKPGVPKVAVLNADDSSYQHLLAIPAETQLVYGIQNTAALDTLPTAIYGRDVSASPAGLQMTVYGRHSTLDTEWALPLASPLLGRYNCYNILAATAVALSQGVTPQAIADGVARMQGFIGRMERIDRGQPFTVIVDFAHTPNALENALRTVRELTAGRVTVVFGCAGLRDRDKRPWMGEIAGRLADRTVITAEDPRTESLDQIMEQVAEGARRAGAWEGETFWRVGDRTEAIALALQMAEPGDLIIVTGKGHEQSMCFGTTEYPWSDHRAIMNALQALGYEGKETHQGQQ